MKKQQVRSFCTVALAAVMTAGTLAGCGSSSSGDTASSAPEQGSEAGSTAEAGAEASTTTEEAGAAQTTASASDKDDPNATAAGNGIDLPELPDGTLHLNVSIADYQQSSDGTMIQEKWQEAMEKYLGCKLDITWTRTPAADYMDNELVVLQSGKVPDVATLTKGSAVNEYGEDGTVLNIADYSKDMVYYPEYMKETCGGEDFARNKDGSMYYFMDGFYNPDDIEGAQSFTDFAYRFDILKDQNLTPATTLDEFDDLCANIKQGIDDGKIDAKYVIMNSTKDYSIYRGFVGIFHTWDCLYYNDGTWRFGPIEDNFREMLKYLNGLYQKGYIDPEFATADANAGTTKATTGEAVICPTLWSGSASSWNTAAQGSNIQWGLAFLPENENYGTPWKWGSRQPAKSLNANMGIYISAETEYPDYVVAMIDYQYSDYMVNLINWGIEGQTYTVASDGTKTFSEEITGSDDPATKSAEYGLSAACVVRSGIPFNPIDFNAMLATASKPEPWWNKDDGYYEGKYWVETSRLGGKDSISPYDRPPVVYLTPEEAAQKAELSYGGVCESRVKELALNFITGESDINDDDAWNSYVEDIKSQTDEDFDSIIETLNSATVK